MATTKVEFHSGVADKLQHACRLLRKSHAAGAQVVVGGDSGTLDRLDGALWTFDALSFVPHARLRAGAPDPLPPAAARAPLWLADEPLRFAHRDVLVNLGPSMVDGWQAFARVIEVVDASADDVAAGRRRWKAYEQPGVERVHHALGGGNGPGAAA